MSQVQSKKVSYPEPGKKYKHYKGGTYEVITLATHTESGDVMVVYKSLLFGSIYVRPLELWNKQADSGNSLIQMVDRFTEL